MIFISRFKNYKLGIRPTIKQVVNSATGANDVLVHKGVVIEFQNAMFNTKDWRAYTRPESPDNINTIKSEADLIRLLRASEYFNVDFFERIEETKESRKAKLMEELRRLEAEEAYDDPENAPEIADENPPAPARKAPARRPAPSKAKSKKTASKILV